MLQSTLDEVQNNLQYYTSQEETFNSEREKIFLLILSDLENYSLKTYKFDLQSSLSSSIELFITSKNNYL